jgi:hypothetical protein
LGLGRWKHRHNGDQGLTKARDEKRIGLPAPYDPTRLVHTFWDIGVDDENVIWFHQTDGVRHGLIFSPTPARACRIACSGPREHDQHAGGEFPRKAVNLN